jgi:hypothetical protein
MKSNYRLSFTGASFFLHETIELAKLCLEYDNCTDAVHSLLSSDVLDRSKSTVKRESGEIVLRLNSLPKPLLERFATADHDDAKIILLYAIIKTYPIIKEFCLEVLYEKILIMDNILQEYEINAFLRKKEEAYEVFDEKSDATKKKLKQVMLKMLADSDILSSTKERVIIKPYIDTGIVRMIFNDSEESYLKALLMNDSEIAMLGVAS